MYQIIIKKKEENLLESRLRGEGPKVYALYSGGNVC